MLSLAVFTANNEQIFIVTLDLPVQACKNAGLSLANVAWYVLHAMQSQSSVVSLSNSSLSNFCCLYTISIIIIICQLCH